MGNKIAGFKLFGTSLKVDFSAQVNPNSYEIRPSGRLGNRHIDWKQVMRSEVCPNCGAGFGVIMAEEGRVYQELLEAGKLLHVKFSAFSALEKLTISPFASIFELAQKQAEEKGWPEISERVQVAGLGKTLLSGSTSGFPVLIRTGDHSRFEVVPFSLNAPIPPAWMFLVQTT